MMNLKPETPNPKPSKQRGGFTLIELLVVLGIAAMVTAMTMAGFNEMKAGNKRVGCQSNLAQVYQAARMYAADEGGKFPFYSEGGCPSGSQQGIGLWALYTFPRPGSPSVISQATETTRERYLRHVRALHCPNDYQNLNAYTDSSQSTFNPYYLSYQRCDDNGTTADTSDDMPTYQSVRDTTPDTPANDPYWQRQLLHFKPDGSDADTNPDFVSRPPADNTVVAWCKWHRTGSGGRDYDNVLFYDGSVQLRPRQADTTTGEACSPLSTTCVNGWRRVPRPVP